MKPEQDFSLRPGIDLLMEVGSRLAGAGDAQALASGAWALLEPAAGDRQHRGGYSELNNDGSPVQLCLTQASDGASVRLLLDPGWYLGDAGARLAFSRQALDDALRTGHASGMAPLCGTLFDALLPSAPAHGTESVLDAYASSFLWLGIGLDQPGCAVYVDVRPLRDSVWEITRRWLAQVLPDASQALQILENLRSHVALSSVGLEGVSRQHGRAKVYWRLKSPCALSQLGVDLLDDPVFAGFLATAIQETDMPLSGLVMSIGFDLATGALEDAKIDLCGHCLPQAPPAWLALLETLSLRLGVKAPPVDSELLAERCEVAFIGAGLDRRGRRRLNVYLKPPGLPPADAPVRAGARSHHGTHGLRERMARACGYLCELQAVDGAFSDYRLPVGESDQWVTAFTGLALAEAGTVADLPCARAAAQSAADWLEQRRSPLGGWGYNASTGADADSTGFAIRLLRSTGRSVCDADHHSLAQRWQDTGGFATYEGPAHWGSVHPCVTAAAYLALDHAQQQQWLPGLQGYLARTARADGTWPAYWWRTHYYSTWHHLVLLRRLGKGPMSGGQDALPAAPPAGAFDLAYAAGIAHLREPGSVHASGLLHDLFEAQRVDGGWTGGFNLRVTDPECAAPWESPSGALYRDQAGSVTTASALFVLAEVLRG